MREERLDRARWALATAATLLLGACSHARMESPAGQTHVYRCAGGFRFVVRFEPQRAWLFLDGATRSVPLVPTRSGFLYTNGEIALKMAGDEARLRLEDTEHHGCLNQPAEAERALK